MARQIKQFRFFNTSDRTNNFPKNLTYQGLVTGNAFQQYYPILQLGIQGLPGTRFFVNNSPNPIIIGNTGIFELNLGNETEIGNLCFDPYSLQTISDNDSACLIVDIIYDSV